MIWPPLTHILLKLPITHSLLNEFIAFLAFPTIYHPSSSSRAFVFATFNSTWNLLIVVVSSASSGLCSNVNYCSAYLKLEHPHPCSSEISFLYNPYPHLVLNILFYCLSSNPNSLESKHHLLFSLFYLLPNTQCEERCRCTKVSRYLSA